MTLIFKIFGRGPLDIKNNFLFYDTKISIVVPVFNEANSIKNNIQLLIDQIKDHFEDFEIIIVSDGSTDNTINELMSLKTNNLQVIELTKNVGKGAAIRKGFSVATGDFLFFVDGGMEIHPKELRIFIGLMLLYKVDIVVGSKRHPQSQIKYPLYRRFLSWIFQILVRGAFDINVTDSQVGMKLFRKDVIMSILPFLEIDRYGFDLELLILSRILGYDQILEAPVRLDYFMKNKKNMFFDLIHVIKVGRSLLSDTIKLFIKVRKIKNENEKTLRPK